MNRVALTFDAEHPDRPRCPPGNAERVLDALRTAGVRATFFVQGRWARSQPDVARRIVAEGHLVGNHSNYHVRMPYLSDEGLRADVTEAEDAIHEICGVDPRPWFRCPFGKGGDDPRVLGALEDLGYRNVPWGVELEDWEPWRKADDVARDAVEGAAAHGDGAIVLLHTWPAVTADALPRILERLTAEGSSLVTIDELEGP
ncbi:MAG TPA: polysaccharide deacetylase family protein [Actinomycetota bacterium]|nr:polysaccharide deacetylase family protein [Actinomycetota bacterium]